MTGTAIEVTQPPTSGLVLKRWTVAEYRQLIAASILTPEMPVELINGQIVEMAPQEPAHAATTDEGGDYLEALFAGKAKVRVQLPITLYPDSEPESDWAIVRLDPNRYRDRHPNPADIYLVMEVAASTLARDRQYKAQIYAKAGIPEYWIVNLPKNQVAVYRQPQADQYQSVQIFGAADKVSPIAFPEIEVDLGHLLILV